MFLSAYVIHGITKWFIHAHKMKYCINFLNRKKHRNLANKQIFRYWRYWIDFKYVSLIYFFSKLGCWLGDSASGAAEGKKIWIPGGNQDRVRTAESLSNCPSKLAINLMNALFTTDQMAEGYCTPSSFHTLLDQTIIQGIRCKYI